MVRTLPAFAIWLVDLLDMAVLVLALSVFYRWYGAIWPVLLGAATFSLVVLPLSAAVDERRAARYEGRVPLRFSTLVRLPVPLRPVPKGRGFVLAIGVDMVGRLLFFWVLGFLTHQHAHATPMAFLLFAAYSSFHLFFRKERRACTPTPAVCAIPPKA